MVSVPLCAAMIMYALAGAAATVYLFGRPLISLDRRIRVEESALRMALARSRDRAEQLALSQGELIEGDAAKEQYTSLTAQQWSRNWWRTSLAGFRDFFSWVADLLPLALVGPMWLAGQVEFGVVPQTVTAFRASFGALTVMVRKFRSVSSLIAEVTRLHDLSEALSQANLPKPPKIQISNCETARVHVEHLTLSLPSGRPLCTDLSFTVEDGQKLLLMGESGVGKTTIIRAIAGLWTDGSGTIQRPDSTAFLSQDPYIPSGSLRRVLTFPKPEKTFEDEEIIDAACKARLGTLLERYELDMVADWEAVLSRGEQQRCCFCRVLLMPPLVVVLDEATSALDPENEAALYDEMESPCIISVAHRKSLRSLHTHLCEPSQDGRWVVKAID